jgi:hypothetical protein
MTGAGNRDGFTIEPDLHFAPRLHVVIGEHARPCSVSVSRRSFDHLVAIPAASHQTVLQQTLFVERPGQQKSTDQQ